MLISSHAVINAIFKQDCKEKPPEGFFLRYYGICPVCNARVLYEAHDTWLRDSLLCTKCQSIPRERALMMQINRHFPERINIAIHESSPASRGVSLILKNQCPGYLETHYFPSLPKGSVVKGFKNEDLENQTFPDETFDLVVTQDVMEHVYDPAKAFKEIARTLKSGGAHIFTVPLINRHKPSEVWATKGMDGKPVFKYQPEYHGNPVDPEGSPVTMHWGFDIVDFIRESSGLETTIEYMYNLEYGLWAEFNEVLVSRKP